MRTRARPPSPQHEFVLGLEQECLTVARGTDDAHVLRRAVDAFFPALARQAPAIRTSMGVFNVYGRAYVDHGFHVEFASAECDSPARLVTLVESQESVVAGALRELASAGLNLDLVANNHSGLLSASAPTFGSHENYLVEKRPTELAELLLPFLASRVYAGAGGVLYPTGHFVAGVRPLFMKHAHGGATTHDRALVSTAREEHHMGPRPARFRLHGIAADGHRSAFNLALQFGATALALKAAVHDPTLRERLLSAEVLQASRGWTAALKRMNRLCAPTRPPRVQPRAILIQRLYLESAERFAEGLEAPPEWIAETLRDWRRTLDAFATDDRAWLSRHLDAFVKYELFAEVLRAHGESFATLAWQRPLFAELALVDQRYHAYGAPDPLHAKLERAGLTTTRVTSRVEPGHEPEPFVPTTGTRAEARARFLVAHAGSVEHHVDWSEVVNLRARTRLDLSDPFATEYATPKQEPDDATGLRARVMRMMDPGFAESGPATASEGTPF